jgi:hypothetical protein
MRMNKITQGCVSLGLILLRDIDRWPASRRRQKLLCYNSRLAVLRVELLKGFAQA